MLKSGIPFICTQLVRFERWKTQADVIKVTITRIFILKMFIIIVIVYELTTRTASTLCREAAAGDELYNLVITNAVFLSLTNFSCYWGWYKYYGTKMEYEHTMVAANYIELYYNLVLLW